MSGSAPSNPRDYSSANHPNPKTSLSSLLAPLVTYGLGRLTSPLNKSTSSSRAAAAESAASIAHTSPATMLNNFARWGSKLQSRNTSSPHVVVSSPISAVAATTRTVMQMEALAAAAAESALVAKPTSPVVEVAAKVAVMAAVAAAAKAVAPEATMPAVPVALRPVAKLAPARRMAARQKVASQNRSLHHPGPMILAAFRSPVGRRRRKRYRVPLRLCPGGMTPRAHPRRRIHRMMMMTMQHLPSAGRRMRDIVVRRGWTVICPPLWSSACPPQRFWRTWIATPTG
mmetsp:Transcript_52378/g.157181  ORF Transcript_52378/g.157181 Transcript_52378/m.157181 type:complete len:286 (+) Transcript_52378:1992-2849(+)